MLSQTFRALIFSRMRVGMERYAAEFPDAVVVLLEPAGDDEVIFFANVFSYADRKRLAEHAYRHTLSELKRRADELRPILARHGVAIDRNALNGRPPATSDSGRTEGSWESLRPLEAALTRLEKALSREQPGHPHGVKCDAEKAAAPNA